MSQSQGVFRGCNLEVQVSTTSRGTTVKYKKVTDQDLIGVGFLLATDHRSHLRGWILMTSTTLVHQVMVVSNTAMMWLNNP